MNAAITFLGGAGTVTGSKYLLEHDDTRILVDCGLFQGFGELRKRNWEPLPVDPARLDAVVLTHAHLDHSGYLPLLVRNGFSGRVICTGATRDLCAILLPDSGYLQEKDAEFANRHKFSRHQPAKPLYTRRDAEHCLERFAPVDFNTKVPVANGMEAEFLPAGHILGAAIVKLRCAGATIVFSGDLGRPGSATMVDPATVREADFLLVESTYGNRHHERADPEAVLADVINGTAARGGTVLIPSFAVGRAQSLLFHLDRLRREKRIPELPVFLDSPMAVNASGIFCDHLAEHKLTAEECRRACNVAHYVRDVEESKALDSDSMPKIIISASGMATGGRVLHHLKHYAPDARNTVLFAGFQAAGTRGAQMVAGADEIRIHGQQIPVQAEVRNLHMLSAHADADEIMTWLGGFAAPPRRTFVTHGEPEASAALQDRIAQELGWACTVPRYGEETALQ